MRITYALSATNGIGEFGKKRKLEVSNLLTNSERRAILTIAPAARCGVMESVNVTCTQWDMTRMLGQGGNHEIQMQENLYHGG